MLPTKEENQRILLLDDYLASLAEAFLLDRRTQGLSLATVKFYRDKLDQFLEYCESQALTQVGEITPDFLRRFVLAYAETHNPGGVHAAFRTVRAFLYWIENEEIMPPEWKNPIRKVKAPKVGLDPISPVSLEEVAAMIATCQGGTFPGDRDKAVLLFLLDTGLRAKEFYNLDLSDLELASGAVLVRAGKGHKPRTVFIGRRTRRAIRAYFRQRQDNSPALWVSVFGDRFRYTTLREILRRRAKLSGIPTPSPHDFRRACALGMLRNGGDLISIQRILGHSGLSVLSRYLAQNAGDLGIVHEKTGVVDNWRDN
jgi:site-specific recombinase XerD